MIYITGTDITFTEADYPLDIEPSIFAKRRMMKGEQREVLRLTLLGEYAAVAAALVDGVQFGREVDEPLLGEDGQPTDVVQAVRYDLSDYAKAGDIVDHRDGRITVYMGKPTEKELLEQAFDQMVLEQLGGGE